MQARKAKRKARKADRKYDESMAYNENLSPEARLHYLENERADKDGTSMYGKGPNFGATEAITIASLAAPYVKPVLSGIESLGAGESFSEGFSMKKKKSLKKDITEFGKTEFGKELKGKGTTALDKLIKGAKMTGKEKGPNLMGMGKKEKRGALAGAGLGLLTYGPLGAIAGGLAGKAFGKGRDRKEAEKGTGANMMGSSISKHMGGRGYNMYGDGANMMGLGKMRKANRKDAYEYLENLKDIAMTPGRVVAKAANIVSGDDPQTPKEARQERREERREARQERRVGKIKGANMKGKKPMMKGENVIVRDAKSGGKKQYNKYGK